MWGDFKNNQRRVPEMVVILQQEENLYLYGNGEYAKTVYAFLEQWDIKIKGVIVSKEYKTDKPFYGYLTQTIEETNEEAVSIIAGYNILCHPDLNDQLCKLKKVDKLFYLNGSSVFIQNSSLRKDLILLDDYYKISEPRNLNYDFYKSNSAKFDETFYWLEDEISKRTMECYLKGHIELKGWPMLPVWKEEDVAYQYFPKDFIQLTDHEIFVDCGAFTGDTLEAFIKQVDSFRQYYALEPDKIRFEKLNAAIKQASMKGTVVHYPVGVSDKKEKLAFSHSMAGCGQIQFNNHDVLQENMEYVQLETIDCLINESEPVSFLKMDIEGAELPALMGAKNTIKRWKPKLAICVYHKREDLITIPQLIKTIVPEYKLYLRAHFPNASEVVLYAV